MANVTLVAGVIDTCIHSYVQHENRSSWWRSRRSCLSLTQPPTLTRLVL